LVDYTAKVKDTGEVFETTSEEEAKKHSLHEHNIKYQPKLVSVGESWIIKGVDEALEKTSVGDKKTIEELKDDLYENGFFNNNVTSQELYENLKQKNDDFLELIDAFDTRQENPGLEHLNVTGVYDSLVTKLFGNMEWHIGPRGNKVSNFKVFGKTAQNKISPLYDFHGQEELDYTIWTKEHILLFEAKALEKNMGLDI